MAVELDLLNANSINNIDTNFERVKEALQDALSREGGLPNEMNADLDMDSNDILNVNRIDVERLSIEGTEFFPSSATAKGDPGESATIEVGTVSTGAPGSNVIIDNVGTESEAILNFTIPRGDTGQSGAGTGDMLAAQNLADVADAATSFGNIKQPASTIATGVVELATEAEAVAGVDTTRAVTAAGLAAAIAATPSSSTDVQIFTSSGTWTKPATGTLAYIIAWGGGGSGGKGGNSNPRAGGGGGGGARVEGIIRMSDLAATVAVTVGAGGASRTGSGTAAYGIAGGNTSFGSHLTAYGGGGGGGGVGSDDYAGGGGGGGILSAGGSVTNSMSGGAAGGGIGTEFVAGAGGSGRGFGGIGTGGGGGGGGSGSTSVTAGKGGNSMYGAAGGGGANDDAAPGSGGASHYSGNGGGGANGSNAAGAGSIPGGGGGGSAIGISGAGARGELWVVVV